MKNTCFFLMIGIFTLSLTQATTDVADTTRVLKYCDLSYSFLLKNQDSAIYYGEQAIELANEINYSKGLAQAFNDLGLVYYYNSDYSKTSALWNKSLEIRKSGGDSLGVAALYNKIGALQYQLGNLDESLKNQYSALKIYQLYQHNEGISKGFNNIASVLEQQGQLKEAFDYYQNSIRIKQEMGDYLEVGGSMLNLASIYLRQNKLVESRNKYLEAIKILESSGFEYSIYTGAAYNNLGRVYVELDSIEPARSSVKKSIEIRTSLGDEQGLISCKSRLGMIELKSNNYAEAKINLLQAVDLSEKAGLKKESRDSYELLSRLYRELYDYKNALFYTDKFHSVKDSILSEVSLGKIAELQTKYETEKKEQQIALQQYEIAEQKAENQRNIAIIFGLIVLMFFMVIVSLLLRSRSRKKQALLLQEAQIKLRETQIEAALNSQELERKRFARDLHDGFGQMISVLNLNLKSLEKGASDREEVFQNSSKVLDDMYKELKGICFNLMPETLIKNGVVDAIKEFGHRVNLTGKLVLEVDTFGITERLNDLQEISIYRITQEWVNNILKYSDADKVTVSLTKDEEEITLLIEDNGSGFDKQKLIEGTGNGWKNMNSRANLIKGELELDTKLGTKGSTLIVNAPVKVIGVAPAQEIPA